MGARNQETVRDAVAALFEAALVGTGKPVQAVYNYKKGKFSGSPVLLVTSGPTQRKQGGMGSQKFFNQFGIMTWVFVADARGDEWTEQMVDDKLDALDAAIADVVAANRNRDEWDYLRHSEEAASIPSGVTVDGVLYQMKIIPLTAEVNDA